MKRLLVFALLASGCQIDTARADWVTSTVPFEPALAGAPAATPAAAAAPSARPLVAQTATPIRGVTCVALQPLGEVPSEMLEGVGEALTELYGFRTQRLESVPLPEAAWYPPRERWRAERLLAFLTPRVPDDCQRILGVTTQDISTTKGEHEDWGILGLADLPGTAAVISSYRTRRRVADVPPQERLERVAVHEVGHTLGLPHCPSYGCYLEDAGGTVDTIDRETFLCDLCRSRVSMPLGSTP